MRALKLALLFLSIALVNVGKAAAHGDHNGQLQLHGDLRLISKNQLTDLVNFKSLQPDRHLYGIGMPAALDAEILVLRGQVYSGGFTEFDYSVTLHNDIELAFFAYTRVEHWQAIKPKKASIDFAQLGNLIETYAATNGLTIDEGIPFRLVADVESLRWFVVDGMGNLQPSPIKSFLRNRWLGSIEERRIEAFGTYSRELQGIASAPDSPMHLHFVTIDDGPKFLGHVNNEMLLSADTTIYLPLVQTASADKITAKQSQ